MFKAARWRNEKNKIKAVFKLQFKATQVPVVEWESMMVTIVPVDIGKPSAKSEKSAIVKGECRWLNPVYETVKLTQDAKTGKIGDKVYQFIVSAVGLSRSGVLGEVKINLAEYADAFKPISVSLPLQDFNNGAILHVTIQRVHDGVEGRENCENEEISVETTGNRGPATKQHRTTLMSQLSNSNCEGSGVGKGVTDVNSSTEEGSIINSKAPLKFHSSRNIPGDDLNGNLRKSNSFDAISASGSEYSSGQYTPNEYRIKNFNNHQQNASFLSPLSNAEAHNINNSTDTSGETNASEKQNSDVDFLARQLEVSDLELQTLRKQVVKESRRGQDLLMEVNSLKEERDSLKKECEALKAAKQKAADDNNFSSMLRYGTKDPWLMLEETKEELDHQMKMNDSLRLQLQKTQEANAELLFAVRDLEELLEQRNMEKHEGTEYDNKLTTSKDPIIKQESIEMGSYHEEEHENDELDMLIKEHDDIKEAYSQERNYVDVLNELELYKKDREDIEMQLEQLALDYEILKQENHDMSSRLDQIQLREQLSMQYECSAHLAVINDLESQVVCLEKEIEKQEEVYEAKLAAVIQSNVEQEQRAIQAEEKLRQSKWNNANTLDNISEDFLSISSQLSTRFHANEEMVMKTLEECRELRLEKLHMADLLDKNKEELSTQRREHQLKCQQLLRLIDFKTTEVDNLLFELKNTREELYNQRKSEEANQKASREEMATVKAELEKLTREKSYLSEQMELKEKMEIEIDKLRTSIQEHEIILQEKILENDNLGKELSILKEEAHKSIEELKHLRQLKVEQDVTIKTLNFKVQTLATECTELKQYLSNESETKSLRKHDVILGEHEADIASNVERSIEDVRSTRIYEDENGSETVSSVHATSEQFDNGTNIKGNYLQDSIAENDELKSYQHENRCRRNRSDHNADSKPEGEEYASFSHDQCKINEVLSNMEELKQQNKSMEAELREMQERYSEMSLKFAEVEGERQQLVIRIRSLKNASKN